MEGLIKRLEEIFMRFAVGEVGNRLFATIALRDMVLNEIKNYKPGNIKDEVKKDNGVPK